MVVLHNTACCRPDARRAAWTVRETEETGDLLARPSERLSGSEPARARGSAALGGELGGESEGA